MLHFAANLSFMFNEWSFLDRFTAAADNGFDAVEYLFPYDFEPEQIASALERNKLTQVLFNAAQGDWAGGERGLAALPERRKEFEEAMHKALRYAEATGAKRLHVMAGLDGSGDTYKASLAWACEKAAPHGIDILIEPLNPRDVPRYTLASFDQAVSLIHQLALPNLKLQFDIYHRQIMHGDVTVALKNTISMIGHVQIASVPNRNEPGSGELNDIAMLRQLDALGYQGYVGCEYRPANGTVAGLSWLRDIASAQR